MRSNPKEVQRLQAGALIAVLFLSVAACAPNPAWEKPGASQAEFDADVAQCRAQAVRVPNAFGNLRKVVIIERSCMQEKGWYLAQQSRWSHAATAPKEDYRECNDEAERLTGTRNIFDANYKDAYERCMRDWLR